MGSQPTRRHGGDGGGVAPTMHAKRRRDKAVELWSNRRERDAKGLVYPLGAPPSPLYIGGGVWRTAPPSPRAQPRGRGLGLQVQSYSY